MIASHYAEPLGCVIAKASALRSAPTDGADVIRELQPGERLAMLDDSLGWVWGYAGDDRRVGYVRSEALRQ